MTLDNIAQIEEALKVSLPEDYRRVMTSTNSKNSGFSYGGLYNTPTRVIQDTINLRETCESFGQSCPRSWVVVGQIDGGDLSFIDTEERNCPLRLWNHETMQVEPFTDTVERFVELVLRGEQ